MKPTVAYLIAFGFIVWSCAATNRQGQARQVLTKRDSNFQKQRELLKSYAACACLMEAYKSSDTLQNDVSLSFYLNLLLYDGAATSYVDSLSRSYARKIKPSQYPDYEGRRAVLFGCIEFSKSRFFDSIVHSLDSGIIGDGDSFFWD